MRLIACLLLACALHGAAEARATGTTHDLHGLGQVTLPAEFRLRGLDGADRALPPPAQLERHQDPRGLVFRFEAHASNDWGGHARDPVLLNVVLLDPAQPAERNARRFSIGRYFSPMGDTIPLDSPRWQQRSEAGLLLRWLAMDDHFGTEHAPRWAMSLHDPARALRLDMFVWRKRYSQDEAQALLRAAHASLQFTAAREAHFARADSHNLRMDRLRETNVARFFVALAPWGLVPPARGATTFGPDSAAWLDSDAKALRAMRVLAAVPLPAELPRGALARPQLPLVLKPGQYPGPTIGGLPSLELQLLYWNAEGQRWHRSGLQRASTNEAHPLLPFEAAVAERLPSREQAYLVMARHHYRPPALDDTADVAGFVAEAERWRGELLGGRILALPATPVRLARP